MRNFPRQAPPDTRGPRLLFKALLALFVLVAALAGSAGLYVDMLWFESLGFESVFWYGIEARFLTFLSFFVLTAALLWGGFRLMLSVAGYARRPFLEVQGKLIEAPSMEDVRKVALGLALLLGVVIGLFFSTQWETWALYLNQGSPSETLDPIFGRPLTFFFFTLPALDRISIWLLMVTAIVAAASLILFGIGMTTTLRGVSLAASFALAALAVRTFLSRYGLLLDDHNLFSGVRYVDDNVVATALLVTSLAFVTGAAIAALNGSGRIANLAGALLLPVAAHLVGGALIPWYVTTFVVRPNELVRETPYIRHNMDFTRKAFNLDEVSEMAFEPRLTNAVFDPDAHEPTLSNMRLWDWQALQDTLRQVQEIRTYYDFPDVDIDRYTVDGKPANMMLATREIDINKLPAGSRNWVNDRLIYTHGYGVTMSSASRFSREGLPEFVLSNMPVESRFEDIRVTRPEIYFGELTNWPVYVKTGQQEFNYPEGEGNNFSSYEGAGGIRMGGLLRRLLLAMEVGDLFTVPFSDDIGPDSALLLHRNIVSRASRLAPFLTFDEDPYMVVGDDGALYWMMDGYTMSDRYPYSRHLGVGRRSVNYVRNSVKVVVDAYHGAVTFYVFDEEDPLIAAYRNVFPDLFRSKADMPEFLAKHVRYPELLFQIQALMYSAYHVDDEQVFYNREDIWTVAQQSRTQGAAPQAGAIEPFFILMSFPGESALEFVSILPFTPSGRNNMIGWMAARSDGEAYGTLRAYNLPKTRLVKGPLQIQAEIDQDAQLSSQLTLWNQQGSTVIRGNLLVIPIEDTILYAQPIYLRAQQSPMPALRLIVLATQDRFAYAPTFDEALELLLAGRRGTLDTTQLSDLPPRVSEQPGGAPAPAASTQTLIGRASQALADYQRLTAAGRLAEAGAKLEELKAALDELNRTGQ